ncbi:MAG: hypothetical protein GF331_14685 [Chitinivibrionales bacterium]|nr:hypothetical protein [Chitinivibrionales bacterium]
MPLAREEINRKLLHILSGSLIPLGIFYLPRLPGVDWRLPAGILGGMLAFSVAVEFARFHVPAVQRLFYAVAGSALRAEEDRRLTGATYIYASSFLCAVVFAQRLDIACMALSVFVLGDAAAAVVGQAFGRIRIGKKSLEGTLACFATCMLLFYAVFPFVPGLMKPWGGLMPLLVAMAASATTAVLELFPVRITQSLTINDNLVVPLATGGVMLALHRFVVTGG